MLFAHLKHILKLDRLRLRGPNGARDEFHLAAAAQNLRKMAKVAARPRLKLSPATNSCRDSARSSIPAVRAASASKRAIASGWGSAACFLKNPAWPKAGPRPEAWKNSCSNTRARGSPVADMGLAVASEWMFSHELASGAVVPVLWQAMLAGHRSLPMDIGADQACVDREALTTDQHFGDATLDGHLEQLAKQVAVAEAVVPVLRKGGVARHRAIETEPAEPAIGKVEMHLLAHSSSATITTRLFPSSLTLYRQGLTKAL